MAAEGYWNCPICLRRVPARVSECYCGRKRQQGDGPDQPPPARSRKPLAAAVLAAVIAALVYAALPRPGHTPAPAEPPTTSVPVRVDPRPLYPGEPRPRRPTPEPPVSVAPLADPTPPPASPPRGTPTPTPASPAPDSADAQRQRGAAAFEAVIGNLSGKLRQLRMDVRRFQEVCPSQATLVRGCDQLREEIAAAAKQIQEAADAADEAARLSWVEPGVRRDIRSRSGMDEVALGEALAAAAAISGR